MLTMNPNQEELRKKSSAARKKRREKLKAKDPEAAARKQKDRLRREAKSRAELKKNNPEKADLIQKARRQRYAKFKESNPEKAAQQRKSRRDRRAENADEANEDQRRKRSALVLESPEIVERNRRQNTKQHKRRRLQQKANLDVVAASGDGRCESSTDDTVGAADSRRRSGNGTDLVDTTDRDSEAPANNGRGMNVDENLDFSQDLSDSESDGQVDEAQARPEDGQWCRNCCRMQIPGVARDSPFHIDFHTCSRNRIKKSSSKLRMVKSSAMPSDDRCYTLCVQCENFIAEPDDGRSAEERQEAEKSRYEWKNIWPSFFWNLISGRDSTTLVPFHCGGSRGLYSGRDIWKFIPKTVRGYWLWTLSARSSPDLSEYDHNSIDHTEYEGCTLESPPPVFDDKTAQILNYRKHIDMRGLAGLLRALQPQRLGHRKYLEPYWNIETGEPKENLPDGISPEVCRLVMEAPAHKNAHHPAVEDHLNSLMPNNLPTCRCAWGCGEFPHRAIPCDPSLLIQIQLRKVQLNGLDLKKLHLFENSRFDWIRTDEEEQDRVLLNKNWLCLPSVFLSNDTGLCVLLCRHHRSNSDKKRLYVHPPRALDNNLSPPSPDNLSPTVLCPRTCTSVRRGKYNVISSRTIVQSGFAGVDCMNVGSVGDFSSCSNMLHRNEIKTVRGRGDIAELAHAMAVEGQISPKLLKEWEDGAENEISEELMRIRSRGSTYVPVNQAVKLQKHSSEQAKVVTLVRARDFPGGPLRVRIINVSRSWCPTVNNIQMNDLEGYGFPIKAVLPYATRGENSSMMLWLLAGIISACNNIHYAIDQRVTPHAFDNFSGHILAHIDSQYMLHRDSGRIGKSPFGGKISAAKLRKLLERQYIEPEDSTSPESYYKFHIDYLRSLLPQTDYPTIGIVGDNADEWDSLSNEEIVIQMGRSLPSPDGSRFVGGHRFEARAVTCVKATANVTSASARPGKYEGLRYMRHGGGFYKWWLQKVRSPLCKWCCDDV